MLKVRFFCGLRKKKPGWNHGGICSSNVIGVVVPSPEIRKTHGINLEWPWPRFGTIPSSVHMKHLHSGWSWHGPLPPKPKGAFDVNRGCFVVSEFNLICSTKIPSRNDEIFDCTTGWRLGFFKTQKHTVRIRSNQLKVLVELISAKKKNQESQRLNSKNLWIFGSSEVHENHEECWYVRYIYM